MKKGLLMIVLWATLTIAKGQDCFGEFSNMVTTSACLNAQGGFEMMSLYSTKFDQNKRFVLANPDNTKTYLKSFNYLEHSGNFFNIHQYGMMLVGKEVYISYKIIDKYLKSELAIVIANSPVFYKRSNIETNPKTGLHTITDNFIVDGNSYPFVLILKDSNLVGMSIGKAFISIEE